jgi:hypothetical protein
MGRHVAEQDQTSRLTGICTQPNPRHRATTIEERTGIQFGFPVTADDARALRGEG